MVTVGCAVYRTEGYNNYSSPQIMLYGDNGTIAHIFLKVNVLSGLIQVWRYGTTSTLLGTGITTIPRLVWAYIEIQATISGTTGYIEVRVNGSTTPDILLENIDTKNGGTSTTIDCIRIGGDGATANGNAGYYDDLYVLNSLGTTNNTFLGDIKVKTITPSSSGTTSQFIGSDGDSVDNYALVNELPYSDTNYVKASTVGERDTYTMENMPVGTSAVYGLQNNIIISKNNTSAINAKSALLINGNLYYGETRTVPSSSSSQQDIYDTNPDSSAPWLVSDIDSIESGIEVS